MSRRSVFLLLSLSAVVFAACSPINAANGDGSSTGGLPGEPVVGSLAPDFELQTLDGDLVHLSDFKGKPALLNFWATWCGPCRVEMPAIQARHEQFGDQFTVLAIDFDEPAVLVRDFVDELGLTFLTLLDPGGEVQALYRVRGYPSSVFVDAEGVIRVYHIGVMTEEQLDDYLRQVGIDA